MRVFAETSWALRESLGFLTRNGHTVSLVGGGGKSTLMYFLAGYCARQGRRVLISTTTRIYAPDGSLFARDEAETECLWDTGKFAVIGTPLPGTGKLAAPEDGFLRRMLERADIAFIEADGAKHRPCKVPRAGEPVLHPQSDVVLGVFGLSAVGKPLPPMPVIPASRTRPSSSSRVTCSGIRGSGRPDQWVSWPSFSMTMAETVPSLAWGQSSMAVTLPETLAWTVDSSPRLMATGCPTCTVSPGFTAGSRAWSRPEVRGR